MHIHIYIYIYIHTYMYSFIRELAMVSILSISIVNFS